MCCNRRIHTLLPLTIRQFETGTHLSFALIIIPLLMPKYHVAEELIIFYDMNLASIFYNSSKKDRKQPYNWWVFRLYGLI